MADRERRLTTIVAIDVAGYSRLMHADETGTLDCLRAARTITDPIAQAHGARLVGTWGDGLLVEFPSVVEAVEFARQAQAAMVEFNKGSPEDKQLLYRIGINLGDVIVEEDDLFGDGVNVAARLEALAPAGGIVLSRAARDQVLDKLDVAFEDLGEIEVKNIARPVRAFRVLGEGEAVAPLRQKLKWPAVATAAVALMVLLAGGAWWSGLLDGSAEADPVLALPEGPKIVVLPFDNLSGDPDQEYFVDGLTEDLTTRLTEHGYLFVIARNSAFKYKGKSPDVRDVGRDLGVDYVVEGSVRRSENSIRVNAQLLNASDGTHIWAQTYDRDLSVESLFDIQDDLTVGISSVVGSSRGAIVAIESKGINAKRPEALDSFECLLLYYSYWRNFKPTVHALVRDCLEAAVERDPDYADAWVALAMIYQWELLGNVDRRPNSAMRALGAIDRAMSLDPLSAWAHSMRGHLMLVNRRKAECISSTERALSLAPHSPDVLRSAATALLHVGGEERAMALWQKVKRLDPLPSPQIYFVPLHVHRKRGEYEEAYRYAVILQESIPNWHWVPATEAYLLAYLGRMEAAREALDRALALSPDFATTAEDEISLYWWSQPDQVDHIMNGLYKAGLPEVAAASN